MQVLLNSTTYLTKSNYLIGLSCPKAIWLKFNKPEKLPDVDEKTQISCRLVRLLITKLAKSTKITQSITGNRFQNSSLATWIIMMVNTMVV